MTDSINIIFDEDGVAREYDDTYDVIIHCESKEEQDKVLEYLNTHAPTTDHTTADPNDCISRQQEIIRCRDCRWLGSIGCAIRIVDDSDRPEEDDFCSFAERRDSNGKEETYRGTDQGHLHKDPGSKDEV